MTASEVEGPDGHTRWSRFAIAVVPAVVAVGVALGGLYTGVLAATFAVGGVDVTVKSNHVDIQHMGAFGDGVTMVNGSSKQVASAGISQAQLTGLCAAIKVPVPRSE